MAILWCMEEMQGSSMTWSNDDIYMNRKYKKRDQQQA